MMNNFLWGGGESGNEAVGGQRQEYNGFDGSSPTRMERLRRTSAATLSGGLMVPLVRWWVEQGATEC
jgi:hypothetical protein